jgi:beta-lactamase class A
MIANSDNNAARLLARNVNPSLTKKLFVDLGLPELTDDRSNFTMTAKECSVFFEAIYNVAYLSPEYSEYAAGLLSNCDFQEGFVKGFPKGVKVWQKFGEWRSAGQNYELHESGIVFIRDTPYLLTVMTKGADTEKLAAAIRSICKVTCENVSP